MKKNENNNLKLKKIYKIIKWKIKININYLIYKIKTSKWNKSKINVWIIPYSILIIILIIMPILIIIIYSIIHPTNNNLIFKFNLLNFIKFFSEKTLIFSLLFSLIYALIAALITIIISYPVAYIIAFCKSTILSKNIWILITLPIWINMLLKIIGLQSLINIIYPNLLGTLFSVIFGMIHIFIPFVILPIYNSLEKIDTSLIEASRDLGANAFKTFWKIIFRHSIPGIITGGSLLIIQSITSLIIVKFMGNGRFITISEIIESFLLKGGNFGLGSAISIILGIIIFLIIKFSNWISKKFEYNKGE